MRTVKALVISVLVSLFLIACGGRGGDTIMVVSREEGSGTRSAFVEMFGVTDANGNDITFTGAGILNSAGAIVTAVAANPRAIGYISMGAMSDRVRILKVNGVEATPEMVLAGKYPISRPFYIGTDQEVSVLTQDFINFILSAQGQQVVAQRGYVQLNNTGEFISNGATGRVTVAGSTSVAPLMERLREAYIILNPNASIEIQSMGTSGGIRAVIDGVSDIAMSSRSFRDSELQAGIHPTLIAKDGLAIAVNWDNPIDNITVEQVRGIYKGQIRNWSEVK